MIIRKKTIYVDEDGVVIDDIEKYHYTTIKEHKNIEKNERFNQTIIGITKQIAIRGR